MENLTGRIEKVIFSAEDSGFCIVSAVDGNDTFKAKGHFLNYPEPGLLFSLRGLWKDSPQYGREFHLNSAVPVVERTAAGLKKFLSATIANVGPFRAGILVDHFGVDLIDILDNDPDRLDEIPKKHLTRAAKASILKEWQFQSSYRDAAIFLMGHKISQNLVERIFQKFGDQTKHVVSENPYCLTAVTGIGFVMADKIALGMGIPTDSSHRLRAGVLHVLAEASRNGHLYLEFRPIVSEVTKLFTKGDVPRAGRSFEPKEIAAEIKALRTQEDSPIIVDEKKRIYLRWNFQTEDLSARLLAGIMQTDTTLETDIRMDIEDYIKMYETDNAIQFSVEQRNGVRALAKSKVLLITGLPGTGKTTLTKTLVGMFDRAGLRFHLLTPTGISAKRLGEVVGREASTIHRALGYKGSTWDYGPHNPFPTDAVIVDEISMVDQEVFYRLLNALPDRAILVLVGDAAQLPSVGAGNVLHELQKVEAIPNVALTQIFRQDEASDIVLNAHRINAGQIPQVQKGGDFRVLEETDPDEIVRRLVSLCERLYEKEVNFQVLSPKYASPVGVDNLNAKLRRALNPKHRDKAEVKLGDKQFRVGDRVIITKNNYTLGVLNGEVGKVSAIDTRNKTLSVKIFGAPAIYVEFKYSDAMSMLKHAYAITIHKCVHPSTLVETDRGLVRISDLPPEGWIATPSGPSEYRNLVRNPERPGLIIETEDGYRVSVTPEHGLDVWGSEGYERREAGNLKPGDLLRLRLDTTLDSARPPILPPAPESDVRAKAYSLPESISSEFGEFLGLMVADGSVYKSGFRLAKRHEDVVDRFSDLCITLFGAAPRRFSENGAFQAEVNSTFLSAWLLSLGGLGPHTKAVPGCVLSAPAWFQKFFLRGLFEDGSVLLKKGRFDHIEWTTSSPEMEQTVRTMLLRFGIICGTTTKPCPNIQIYGYNAVLFRERVGFIAKFKKARLASAAPVGSSKYTVPLLSEEVKSIWQKNKAVLSRSSFYQNGLNRGRVGRSLAEEAVDLVDSSSSQLLQERLDFHHSKIKSITPSSFPSVCVEVPDGHQFFQNGFSGWNSQGMEYDWIIFPFTNAFYRQLQRNLLYTAATRARDRVVIFGDWRSLQRAALNDEVIRRNSALSERVVAYLELISEK